MQRSDSRRSPDRSRLRVLGLANIAGGLWLIVLPFAFDLPRRYPHQLTFWSFLTTGALVLTLAIVHVLRWSTFRLASRGNLVLGLWLVASPALLGYTNFLRNGRDVALAAVFTGLGVVAGAALSLAGSDQADDAQVPAAHQDQPTVPVLWPEPVPGQPPRPFTGRAEAPYSEATARRRLPIAWAAVATLIVAAVVLGLAVALLSWPIAITGIVIGIAGSLVAARTHVMADVSVGQSPGGP